LKPCGSFEADETGEAFEEALDKVIPKPQGVIGEASLTCIGVVTLSP